MKHGLVKESSETLEEFFQRVNDNTEGLDFTSLLFFHNNWLYGNDNLSSWDEIYFKWEEILKKLSTWH